MIVVFYRRCWWLVVVPVNGVALLGGLRFGETATMLLGSMLAGCFTALALAVGLGSVGRDGPPARRILRGAGMVALLFCLTAAWDVLVGAAGLLVVAMVVVSAPATIEAWQRRTGSPPSVPAATPGPRAWTMSDRELCRAWRTTARSLRRAPSVSERARLARNRQAYLDELVRRNPVAMRAWLGSGQARPDTDPGRFLFL